MEVSNDFTLGEVKHLRELKDSAEVARYVRAGWQVAKEPSRKTAYVVVWIAESTPVEPEASK